MPNFKYKGLTSDKRVIKGIIDADDTRKAIRLLKTEHEVVAIFNLKLCKTSKLKKYLNFKRPQLKKKEKADKSSNIRTVNVGNVGKNDFKRKLRNILETDITVNQVMSKPNIDENIPNIFIVTEERSAEQYYDYEEVPAEKVVKKREVPKFIPERSTTKNAGKVINWDDINSSAANTKKIKVRLKPKKIEILTRRMSLMLKSGVSLSKTLSILADDRDKNVRKVMNIIYNDIQNGNPLSYALSHFPKQFDKFYISIVALGENTGTLDKCLLDIADSIRKTQAIRKKMKNAMIYPCIILAMLSVLMVGGSLFLVPLFESLFSDTGQELPMLSKVVFSAAKVMPYAMGGLIVFVILFTLLRKNNKAVNEAYKRKIDMIALRVPLIKDFVIKSEMFYFSHTLYITSKNGIRILDGLYLAQEIAGNSIISAEIYDAEQLIIQGIPLSEALNQEKDFDSVLCGMVFSGEESGSLTNTLNETANYYSMEVDQQIATLTEWIQPMSILLVAAIAVPVIFAIYLPILSISSGQYMKGE